MNEYRNFASDNNASVHGKVMDALIKANEGHARAYGDEDYTKTAVKKFRELLSADVDVYFVYNGTGANVLGLSAALKPYDAVICAETAHINVDECGAPEKFTGCKLITLPSADGKIRTEQMEKLMHVIGVQHHSQPKVISITQSTEMGTVYTVNEIKQIAEFAHRNDMYLHMDGARIANAAAALNMSLYDITGGAGVDILSFGGAKNGIMYGEAVVFFNKKLSEDFMFIRKNGMQLASKMRYIAAQFDALLTDNLWLENALHANAMARLLADKVKGIQDLTIVNDVSANAIFAVIPREAIKRLQEKSFFEIWDEEKSMVRWMTAFDTTEEDVERFVADIKHELESINS